MTADHLSYKRATSVSLIGMAIQAVLAVVVLLYGIFANTAAGGPNVPHGDPGAQWAAFGMLMGLPIWFALSLVFHQHKLERLEALEAEAFRRSAAGQASVFEESASDQTVQAGRLAWMHRWFLPAIGLLVGAGYLTIGSILFYKAREYASNVEISQFDPAAGWAISVGVGVAVLGFIFARFVSGMAKQKVWALLNAGSASAVLCALVGATLAIAHFVFVALKAEWGLRYLPIAVGVAWIALGAEMVLHFVLNLYRPRRPGEYLRPAFDSRVLAFIAAPDRLAASISDAVNYQFGFNVSSTWFYRLFARSILPLLVLAGLTIWLLSSFVVVRPDEKALLFAGGVAQPRDPGIIFKKPWPFDVVEVFPASAVNELLIGSAKPAKENEPILWTNEHSADEAMMLVQPSSSGGTDTGRDLALLSMEVPVHYIVRDLKDYKTIAQDSPTGHVEKMRQDLLLATASGEVIRHIATYRVDQLLGEKRSEITADLKKSIQAAFDRLPPNGAGIEVTFVGISGVHPKQDIAPSFEKVVQADQKRITEIEQARKTEIETLARVAGDVDGAREIIAALDKLDQMKLASVTGNAAGASSTAAQLEIDQQEQLVMDLIVKAGGEAAGLVSTAKAARWERSIGERAKAVRSEGQIASFRAAPAAYKAAMRLEALREAGRGAKIYISPFDNPHIRFNDEDIQPDVSGFRPVKTDEKKE